MPPTIAPAVVLLDVDGVINVARPSWPDPDKRSSVYADGINWPMRWSPQLLGELVALFYLDLINIRWCTTWCPHADKLNALFDLPAFEPCWTDLTDVGEPTRQRKLAAARDVIASGRRLIWIDDDAIPPAKIRKSLAMYTADALYLIPNAKTGLSPAMVKQIEAFALAPYRTAEPAAA